MDSLTAHHLARELDARWRGRPVTGSALDRQAQVFTLVVSGAGVSFDLSRPDVTVRETRAAPRSGVLKGWTVAGVHAPEDDRRIVIDLVRAGRFKGSAERRARLQVSVMPTARGVDVHDARGTRLLALGAAPPPRVVPRPLLDDARVEEAAHAGDHDALLRGRWVSAPVARWLVADPAHAAERYRRLTDPDAVSPAWCDGQLIPFPMLAGATAATSLVAPAEPAGTSAAGATPGDGDQRLARARRRLHAELERARGAPLVRAAAQALLELGDEPAPPRVRTAGGATAETGARPGESSRAAAERLFAEAQSMERALTVVPRRLAALEARALAVPPVPAAPRRRAARGSAGTAQGKSTGASFRRYRSSGGLEIWVGRGARSNDELTFHAAHRDDVWLHARDAAGAHVVLRWARGESPPARDLREAARLAAWHSKARGSTVVPVDWTRRKWVRKPRGGAPGLVLVDRAKTLFVRPDGALERRLREG